MLLPGPDLLYIARGSCLFVDFSNMFLPNIGDDQKKLHHLSAGPLADSVPYYGKSGPG